MAYDPAKNVGAFLPQTDDFTALDVNSPEFKVRLYQGLNNLAVITNIKDSGYYPLIPFVNGQLFFPDPLLDSSTPQIPTYRNVTRQVYNCGPLPAAAGIKTVDTGIDTTNNIILFARIYGVANKTTSPMKSTPLPGGDNVGGLADQIFLWVEENIVTHTEEIKIQVGKDQSAYDTVYVILEWIVK